jgi:hypothetical protein
MSNFSKIETAEQDQRERCHGRAHQSVEVEHEALLDVLLGRLAPAPVFARLQVGELGVRVVEHRGRRVRDLPAQKRKGLRFRVVRILRLLRF